MSEWMVETGLDKVRRAHAHGFREVLRRMGYPWLVMRVYWACQPIRCLFRFHDWYSTAAGECAACTCGASEPYPTIVVRWTRDPVKRRLASSLMHAEYRADVWQDAALKGHL